MKTILTYFLILALALTTSNCDRQDDTSELNSGDPPNGPVIEPVNNYAELKGYPKNMNKYINGILEIKSRYYYREDGQIGKITTGNPQSGTELSTDLFQYDNDGKLVSLESWDTYYFTWDGDHITEAMINNSAWYGLIKFYSKYNDQGQIVEEIQDWMDASSGDKKIYTYFEDGNLKSIEWYQDKGNGEFSEYSKTSFSGYTTDKNLFPELVIIPGQVVQKYFPLRMEYTNYEIPDASYVENYQYTLDDEGRVITKEADSLKIVYEYY